MQILKKIRGDWRLMLAAIYVLITLPFSAIFIKSEYVRFINYNLISHWNGKLFGLKAVFVGDSITAGGMNWSMRLGANPFNSINLAGNGYTSWQIKHQIGIAAMYSPEIICILAGTNDVISHERQFSIDQFKHDFEALATSAKHITPNVIVTLIPYTSYSKHKDNIIAANKVIVAVCNLHSIAMIDLNGKIASDGLVNAEYTMDGVHFTEATYSIWAERIQDVIERNPWN